MNLASQTTRSLLSNLSLETFGFSRVAVVLTGSAGTQVMPYWLDWAQSAAPQTEFRVIMRKSAYQFITRHNIESRLRTRIQEDRWQEEIIASHIELGEWADLMLIYPATLGYSSKLARGLADSPSLVAALSTRATVCVAPSLPPRSKGNPIVEETLRLLREPDNFVVFDPVPGPSESSDIDHAWIPPTFPEVLRQLERRRAALETQTSPRTA